MIPQILMIILMGIALGTHLTRHGEKNTIEYHFGARLLVTALNATILYYGGFWNAILR